MRIDARNLLARLGKSDFAYKEFADRFSDLELWPLLEALLKDPRLFVQAPLDTRAAAARFPHEEAGDGPTAAPLGNLFGRYESMAGRAPEPDCDVRAMLRRLSDAAGPR